jgi:protein phosphatase PTC7
LSDNVPQEHILLLQKHVTDLLNQPENGHLNPDERDAEMARLFADVLVGYGRMAMARTGDEPGWKTPSEVEARKEGYGFKGGKMDE